MIQLLTSHLNNKLCFNISLPLLSLFCIGCKSGVYGSNCDIPCPVNCAYSTCHIDLGTCYDCKPGWTGTLCKKGMIAYKVFNQNPRN